MIKFSSTVKVVAREPQDFGSVVTVEAVQPSVGIDVTPEGPVSLHLNEDPAMEGLKVEVGSELILTLSDEKP